MKRVKDKQKCEDQALIVKYLNTGDCGFGSSDSRADDGRDVNYSSAIVVYLDNIDFQT